MQYTVHSTQYTVYTGIPSSIESTLYNIYIIITLLLQQNTMYSVVIKSKCSIQYAHFSVYSIHYTI